MSEFVGKDGDGKDVHFIQYDGLNYPAKIVSDIMANKDLEKQLKWCRDINVREDDLFIPAYVKSGMHWLWEIVTMLANNTTEYSKKHKEGSMLDFIGDQVNELPSPRVLNLHFPLRYFPQQAIEKRCKIIHIMRNPKDVFVSYFNHYSTLPTYEKVDSFSSFLPMMLGENGFYIKQAWYQYELEWEKFVKDNPTYPILLLYYEDLKEDLGKWVGKIAEFLKVDVSEDTVQKIADKCDIDKQRQAYIDYKENHDIKQFKIGDKPMMFRKGMVGDWKNWFTVAENERMDAWIAEHLVNTDLKFRYTL